MSASTVKAREDLRLISLGAEIGRAASLHEAYALIVRRLEGLLAAPCALCAHDGTDWHTIAHAGAPLAGAPPDRAVRIPLPHGRGETELLIGARPSASSGEGGGDALAAVGAALIGDQAWRETLAHVLGAALQLVALRAREAEAQRCADLLRDFSHSLLAVSDRATLHRLIVEGFARAADADVAALAVYQPSENALAIVATHGYPAVIVEHVRIAPGDGVIGRVFASGEPLVVPSSPMPEMRTGRRRYRTDSFVALPLHGPDGVVAVVSLTDKRSGQAFSAADIGLLTSLSFAAALAVSREVLRTRTQDLAHLATVDPLTGLFNRRYFETRLEQELQRQRRQFDELSLLILDLDNFKALNDTQGHLVGDIALKEVAEILRRAIRIFDVCARFGGEEFVILMPGAGPSTALRIAERIRRQVEQHFATGLRSSVPVPLTVSIGVSTATPTVTREALIAEADTAMLHAKVTGKNQVHLHTAP